MRSDLLGSLPDVPVRYPPGRPTVRRVAASDESSPHALPKESGPEHRATPGVDRVGSVASVVRVRRVSGRRCRLRRLAPRTRLRGPAVELHANAASAKGHSLDLQPQALLSAVLAAQGDPPSRTDHSMPR